VCGVGCGVSLLDMGVGCGVGECVVCVGASSQKRRRPDLQLLVEHFEVGDRVVALRRPSIIGSAV
jgi:hypothetical protein